MRRLLNTQDRIAARYIPAGYAERKFTTTDGKGIGVVYYKECTIQKMGMPVTRYHTVAYRGNSSKPWNNTFATIALMESHISALFNAIQSHQDYKNKEAAKRRDFVPTLTPGDILDTCWGYDQTNREFFQVIRITGKTAVLREIAQKEVARTGPFSGTVIGMKDQFTGKEISRRVSPGNSVRIDEYRYASLWDGKPANCSWGA